MAVWEEIVDYTVPSNTTSVDFTGLNITKDDFIKMNYTIINSSSSSGTELDVIVNDVSSGFFWQELYGIGSGVGSGRANISRIAQVSAARTTSGNAYIKLSENNIYNHFSLFNRAIDNGSATDLLYNYVTSTNTFNSITKLSFTATMAANSRIQIYRLTAEKVADITVASNTTQVDITGLSIDKGSEYLLVSDCLDPSDAVGIGYNQNTTVTDYYKQRIGAAGSSPFASRFNDAYYMVAIVLDAIGYQHIKISNTGSFTVQSYFIRDAGGSSPLMQNSFISSIAQNITNINELNIYSSNSNGLKTNSRFQLYKLY